MAEVENSDSVTVLGSEMSELAQDDELEKDEDQIQENEPMDDASILKTKLKEAQRLADERLDQLKRCRADLDNTLKIAARDREEHAKFASEKLICKLLCVLDSLEQASKHDEGCNVLYHQLSDILKGEGLEPIEAVGKQFNPYRHEALMQVASDELEEGCVAQEIQRGYTLNSKVIRFSKVGVAKRR